MKVATEIAAFRVLIDLPHFLVGQIFTTAMVTKNVLSAKRIVRVPIPSL